MPYPSYGGAYSVNPYSGQQYGGSPFIGQQSASAGTQITWVQGENGAKAYPLAPNSTMILMDSEQTRFYIKTTDASGMPAPLRVFSFEEITNGPQGADPSRFVSREEFDELKKRLDDLTPAKKAKDNG